MATLISFKKSPNAWGKVHNGAKMYVLSCYFSEGENKYNFMGQTTQYHCNINISALTDEEADVKANEFIEDKTFHTAHIKCYDFSLEDLTKNTDYECASAKIVGTDLSVSLRHVASPYAMSATLAKERARCIRLFKAGKWTVEE